MQGLNIKQLEAYPLTLDQFDGNIRDMVESIYVGPQGTLLEPINNFNDEYNIT